MDGYDERSYGDGFADVYDDWYADVSDVDATVATLLELANDGRALELGVGTGRIAIPLAHAGLEVVGIDTSSAMLDRLRAGTGAHAGVDAHIGNMVGPLPAGPFGLVFVAYNTLFNLTSEQEQRACFAAVADALAPGGRFVVEAFVPETADGNSEPATSDVSLRTMTADQVVLSVSRRDPDRQLAEGQFIEITEAGGVRLRPWAIRYSTPEQLDRMADGAGFDRESRWASFARDTFTDDADRHVTVYRRRRSPEAATIDPPSALS